MDAVSTALGLKASRAEVAEVVDARVDEARLTLERAIADRASIAALSALQDDVERRAARPSHVHPTESSRCAIPSCLSERPLHLRASLRWPARFPLPDCAGLVSVRGEAARAEDAAHAAASRIDRERQAQAKELHSALGSKASIAEVQLRARTSEVESMLALKPDRSEIEMTVHGVALKLDGDISRAAQELRSFVEDRLSDHASSRNDVSSNLSRYCERSEMEAALRQKADTREVEMWLQSKAGLTEMSTQLELLGAELARGLDGKVTPPHTGCARALPPYYLATALLPSPCVHLQVTQPELNHACEQLEGRMASEMNAVRVELQSAIGPLANASPTERAGRGGAGGMRLVSRGVPRPMRLASRCFRRWSRRCSSSRVARQSIQR